MDDTVVTDIIEKIEAKFGKMTVTRGKHHVFWGMEITFNDNDGTVTILMKEYLKEAIADSGMDASKVAPTPAKKDLPPLMTYPSNLTNDKAKFFTALSQNYVSKRARTNAQLAIAFLCTRVSCSTEQDWKKLIRLLQYFNGTLVVERSCASIRSRNSIQRALLKPKLLVQVIIYLTLSGPGCFWPK